MDRELGEARGRLLKEIEEACEWIDGTEDLIRSFDDVYPPFEAGRAKRIWRRKNPVIMTTNPTYRNYRLFMYVTFNVLDEESDYYNDRLEDYLMDYGDVLQVSVIYGRKWFNEQKKESATKVISSCRAIGNMKLIDAPIIGDWLKKMVVRGSPTLTKMASFTVKEFMSLFNYYVDKRYKPDDYERYKRAVEEFINIKNKENLTDIEFDEYIKSLYYFSIRVPHVHEVITEELAKLLKSEIGVREEKIPAVLKGYWC